MCHGKAIFSVNKAYCIMRERASVKVSPVLTATDIDKPHREVVVRPIRLLGSMTDMWFDFFASE